MPSFYASDTNFLNTSHSLNLKVIDFWSNLLFEDDSSRIIYSTNGYAFRKRSDSNKGVLNMPFINLKIKNFTQSNERNWFNHRLEKIGIFIKEIESNIRMMPVIFEYEASFWANRDDEVRYAMNEINWLKEMDQELNFDLNIKSGDGLLNQDFDNIGLLDILSPDLDPEYAENDWLEKNKIHSISMDFNVHTFLLKTNYNITIPTEAIFNFVVKNGIDGGISTEDAYTFTIDHINEEVVEN